MLKNKRRDISALVECTFRIGNRVAMTSFAATVEDLDISSAIVVPLIRDWRVVPPFVHYPSDPLMPFDRDHFYNYIFEDDFQICEEQEDMLLKWTSLAIDVELTWLDDREDVQWSSNISIEELRRCARGMQHNAMMLVEECGYSNFMLQYLSLKLKFMLAIGAGRSGWFAKMQPLILEHLGSFLLGEKWDWIAYPDFASNPDCPVLPTDPVHFWNGQMPRLWVNHPHEEFWRLRVAVLGMAKQLEFMRLEVDHMNMSFWRLCRISRVPALSF